MKMWQSVIGLHDVDDSLYVMGTNAIAHTTTTNAVRYFTFSTGDNSQPILLQQSTNGLLEMMAFGSGSNAIFIVPYHGDSWNATNLFFSSKLQPKLQKIGDYWSFIFESQP